MHVSPITPGQRKSLQWILEKRPVKIHQGILSALKARGWIQRTSPDSPMEMATGYTLTPLGQQTLGLAEPSSATHGISPIGMEAETCEECGGSGQLLVLDERDQSDPCPWCLGSGRVADRVPQGV
ncbi:MAG: hypothetical protein HQM00_10190 [Magnetococcales bacterium]|nr:hypothetical protein [Magnetococcales bacterium]